jgi:lysophospholipase L1-like esterase
MIDHRVTMQADSALYRFAAMGDSTTVGMGDPLPSGGWRGWAALLAESHGATLHNFAVSGARTAGVAGAQVPAALAVRPHVASLLVGSNDTLRDTFDVSGIGRALAGCVGTLHTSGAVVLTARLPDPGRMLGLPAGLARPLARRIGAINAVSDAVARRFGTVHVDLANHPAVYERRMWSVDRLHPSERGHRLLARCFAEALRDRGFGVRSLPEAEPCNPEPTRSAHARWMATAGTRWVLDRCTDLVPALVGMAALEWWHGLRGIARALDDRLARDVADALSDLPALSDVR